MFEPKATASHSDSTILDRIGLSALCPVTPRSRPLGRTSRFGRLGPTTDIIGALDTVSSLYEEPFFSCRQGGGSPPPAATGSPSPIRAVSEQHLHAMLSLVRRTGRRSSVPLASRPSGNRLGRFPTNAGPRRFPDGLLSRWNSLSHSCHPKLCKCGKLFQILVLLPFLHSPRRFFPWIDGGPFWGHSRPGTWPDLLLARPR
jgi:hypothetical protein